MKRKAIFLLYRVLPALASPVLLFYLLLRGFRTPRYFATLRQRCGYLPSSWEQTLSASIWLHAVSVGEVLAAIPLIDEIRQRNPGAPLFLSTTTLAGCETAQKRLGGAVDGIFFAPFDLVWAVRRVLRHLRPTVVVILETEIWPNLFREVNRLGCGLLIVNARISDRALPRYRKFAPLFSSVLSLCDRIVTQSEPMQQRFIQAGAPAEITTVGGNLKYDFTLPAIAPDSPALAFLHARPGTPVWIAASTSADDLLAEEETVIAAQRDLPGWRLIIAPRKPERFAEVARRLTQSGLPWTSRSSLTNPVADILLLDSIGELSALFAHATVVFMGGTLASRGGHNVLEPASFGKPVIAGPHMENFPDIAEHFEAQRALLRIATGSELAGAVRQAAADPTLGERARAASAQKRGAAAHIAEEVTLLYRSRYPCERPPQPVFVFLWLLSLLWKAGSAIDRQRKRERQRSLPVPIVSIGNITAGGTGKTPMIIELLRDLRERNPAVLTRGHGRSTNQIVLLLDNEAGTPIGLTGDEAKLCSRATRAPIGIGGDRYSAGMELLGATSPGLVFLDDGFQHLQLHRDFDLVLIDAIRPFGGGYLLPLGRLREPMQGLARAHAFVITRARRAPNSKAIEAVLRRYNPDAPVFCASIEVREWMNGEGDRLEPSALKDARAVAFCGLGNPEAFWGSLHQLGIEPLDRHTYDDHHRYTPSEIRRLARHALDVGATTLLTTAKDAINLDPDYAAIIAPLKLYWLEIGFAIENREALVAMLQQVRKS